MASFYQLFLESEITVIQILKLYPPNHMLSKRKHQIKHMISLTVSSPKVLL
uniref:Uncharacterized protein n=1 Tax=Arundo donax TaxID=35708 RepID=A0A0A9G283_ARUDO